MKYLSVCTIFLPVYCELGLQNPSSEKKIRYFLILTTNYNKQNLDNEID